MECIFCKIIQGEIPSKVLYEDEFLKVIMGINPTVDGHALIIPKKHYTDYLELDQNIITHMWEVAQKIGPSIMKKIQASSLSLLVNFGVDQQVKLFLMHLLPNFGAMEEKATKKVEEVFSILKD